MIAYKLFWLLKMNGYLYLVTGGRTEPCSLRMTAATPKKVSRSITLEVDPDNLFLMYQTADGRILWRSQLLLGRDASGMLYGDVTDVLRNEGVPFTFCTPGQLRHYKASTYELWDYLSVYDWGCCRMWDGFALESTAGATLTFFPGSCHICGQEIFQITVAGFGWSNKKLRGYIDQMQSSVCIGEETACRCLEEQGSLTKLSVTGDRVTVTVNMFFCTSFNVEGFGQERTFQIHESMFQENGCAPCETARFGPLICMILKAADEEALEQALQWGVDQHILEK